MDAVLNWLWQGGVVAVALGLMLFSLERASANVRSVVCWAAALFVIALPALPSLPPTITSAAFTGVASAVNRWVGSAMSESRRAPAGISRFSQATSRPTTSRTSVPIRRP